ncbi:hypothetical protein [Burkholderia ubonensis]|uniref:hypothetical protein n=1 Tax=Burkholderia ubonensis TaxID=101571 RepID=UPI00075C7E2A|nr:hypothetical protein [Burkholderia ubonensis]KVP16800.1 hypothetical protein WJ84_00575 [Burkholderia ubonensis]
MTVISLLSRLLGRTNDVPAKTGLSFGRSSVGAGRPIVLDDATLRSHVAISGRVGVGVQNLVEQLLSQQTEKGRGWVYIDPACDEGLLERLAAQARAHGRGDEFYVLDLHRPENSNTYDVLRAGTLEQRAIRALQVLPAAENNPGAQFYAQQGYNVLVPVFGALDAAGKSVSLRDLGELLMQLESDDTQRELLNTIPTGHPARDALLAAFDSIRKNAESDTQRLRNVLGGLAGRLYIIGSEVPSEVFGCAQPEIEFGDILAHNKMCYVRLPVMAKDQTMLALARMLLHDVSTSVAARARTPSRLRTPFLCIMDAFPAYGLSGILRAPMTSTDYSHARGMSVSMVPVMDEGWDNLHETYADGLHNLIGNTFTKVYFQQKPDELTKELHPDMPESSLAKLTLGEFVMWKGATGYRGLLSPMPATDKPPAFTRQAMALGEAHARLQLANAVESVKT